MPEIDEFEKMAKEALKKAYFAGSPVEGKNMQAAVMYIAQALREVHDRGRQEMYDMVTGKILSLYPISAMCERDLGKRDALKNLESKLRRLKKSNS